MLNKSFCSTRRRVLAVSAAAVFACLIAFYTLPFSPLSRRPSHNTSITADDIAFAISGDKLSDPTRHALCSAHHVPTYSAPASNPHGKRKVYDLFMLNTELDWLEIRLNELAPQVDYFVILEAPTTFTGLPKKMYYQDNASKFSRFKDKIIHHVLTPPGDDLPGHTANSSSLVPGSPDYEAHAWVMERYQRNAMFTQVVPFLTGAAAPATDDVLLVSDIDEIPRPATVQLLRECDFGRMTTLRSRFYYYSFQWLHRGQEWAHPQATTYQGAAGTLLPASLRERDGSAVGLERRDEKTVWNAAWHCSSCFATIAEMLDKMKSFSHTNLNAERFRDRERIVQRIREGKDLWDRWFQWYKRVEGNQDLPVYLKQEAGKGRFGYMVDRDGKGAGFTDYE